ncbi:MAG TPA: FlgD immunoglobulin-like domain containing protein [Candidatus Eisenbacteria bacterium]|nr:FlgD immunoglobulin-like domain containing protein [Candidatus Eisenbacteria bacterium]
MVATLAPGTPRAAQGAWDCGPCPPAPQGSSPVLYKLEETSSFQYGCFGPCACPLLIRNGLIGTFVLITLPPGPLYSEYRLCGIDWRVPAGPNGPEVRITGNGWYRVGGEVAVEHALTLCVSVDGGETQVFESGLVQGGGGFPRIDIEAATSGFFCWDTVTAVKAAPASAGAPWPTDDAAGLRARPNPSRGPVEVEVFLREPAAVSLAVIDPQGREVRTLVRDARLPAGAHPFRWDGLRRDGSRAPAGLYLLRLKSDGREIMRRLVKL